MENKVDVVLFNPPFYRFCGSHNDRAPVSLCYLSRYLKEEGISHVVYNADFTGAKTYWSMRWMFENFDNFKDAVDGKGSLYGEVLEVLMSFNPKTVIIMGGELLFPTKDWGNPYISSNFAKRIKAFGIYTVGIGSFFTIDKERFKDYFDCIVTGEPNSDIVQIIRSQYKGYIAPKPMKLEVIPNLENLYPKEQIVDYVMTSFGCFNHCDFCLVQKLYKQIGQNKVRFAELETVIEDIKQRHTKNIYLTDLNFSSTSIERLEQFTKLLKDNEIDKNFTIESRIDGITPEKVDMWVKLGIKRVKLGIEGGTNRLMKSFKKGTSIQQSDNAVRILKERGIAVVVYLIVGGEVDTKDYQLTREYVKKLNPEFVAVNVWSYDLTKDYRYDTQFSPVCLERWNIDKEEFFKHLELQNEINPTMGQILDVI